MKNPFILTFMLLIMSLWCELSEASQPRPKPNFVWLISEDNSKHYLSIYNQDGASMPNLEQVAKNGLVFEQAYANSPVCSTARTTLALGVYGPTYNLQQHRSFLKTALPDNVKPLSQLLQQAGYYTSNKTKEDYNFDKPIGSWNNSSKTASWRNREESQPFFHVQSFATTHESSLHFPTTDMQSKPLDTDISSDLLSPKLPATELMKYTHQRYLKQHEKLDKQLSQLFSQLKQDGLWDTTFVFYFGDHGGVLPGSKGYLFDRGLSVPLVMHVPKNYRHLMDSQLMQQNSNQRPISFVDFAPSVLALAQLPRQSFHQGRDVLSSRAKVHVIKNQRQFYYADRFDEKYDLSRAVRVGYYKYIRHFQPHYPDSLFNNYRYKQAAYREMKSLYQQEKLTPQAAAFFRPKPVELLFDVNQDPDELVNLAAQPKYASQLSKMRRALYYEMQQNKDLGLLPESFILNHLEHGFNTLQNKMGAEHQQLVDISQLQTRPFHEIQSILLPLLDSESQWSRYWAVISLNPYASQLDSNTINRIKAIMHTDQSQYVQARAFELLAAIGQLTDASYWQRLYQSTDDSVRKLELLNIATFLYEKVGLTFNKPDAEPDFIHHQNPNIDHKWVNFWIDKRWAYLSK